MNYIVNKIDGDTVVCADINNNTVCLNKICFPKKVREGMRFKIHLNEGVNFIYEYTDSDNPGDERFAPDN